MLKSAVQYEKINTVNIHSTTNYLAQDSVNIY